MDMLKDQVKRCQRRKKLFAIEQFGGKCEICGYDRCPGALAFHHKNPSDKEFTPSYVINSRSWENAKEELIKCMLLCANCHAEIHYEELDLSLRVDYKAVRDYEITCVGCGVVIITKMSNQKYCTTTCRALAQRKVKDRPSKGELKKMVDSLSWVEIGRRFGVSDNAVRKWAKAYGLLPRKTPE